ncbi:MULTISPECIES: AraC family transcriptional regulator [unclassified Sphingobium]|uniref:AraC family transcriptional regulator n=1 Tax=unclassified Sphingobium TaxID=2611147 RepID=UPI000C9FAD1C|nr:MULTISPECIES: AraC family transcriptional regulator [unclassified Sphingobium]MCB4859850.1 AraC family transcriptional regulator [Sphingobium sp. PNB]
MAENPDSYRDNPASLEDPLSQILSLIDARAVMSSGLRARGLWAVRVAPVGALKCNIIKGGQCQLEVGAARWALEEGSCFLVGANLPFIIGTDLDRIPKAAEDVFAGVKANDCAWLDTGPGPDFHCLGGRMDLPATAGFLADALPPVIVIHADEPAAVRLRWLVDRLEEELSSGSIGASVMAATIMQMIFIEMIRNIPSGQVGSWLAALADPRIGASLRALHQDPERNWRIEDLASVACLSRSRFSARFRSAVGLPPMGYLTRLRIALAQKALAQPGTTITAVAARAGYGSESAFGFAFRRITGVTPRQVQKQASREKEV